MMLHAILLSAGRGERLKPLTDKHPKCLLPLVNDKPILDYWIQTLLSRIDGNIYITCHHLFDQVANYIFNQFANESRVKTICFINYLPSTAIAIQKVLVGQGISNSADGMAIINSDTYIPEASIDKFLEECRLHNPLSSNQTTINIGYTLGEDIKSQSRIELNEDETQIISFEEKCSKPGPGYFWSGIATISPISGFEPLMDNLKPCEHDPEISEVLSRGEGSGIVKYPVGIPFAFDMGKDLDTYRDLYKKLTLDGGQKERLDMVQGVPLFGGVYGDHIARYLFAMRYCMDKTVVDIGCGTCYGLKMLTYAARSAAGVDRVEHLDRIFHDNCNNTMSSCPVYLHQCDIEEHLPPGQYEVVVLLEVIEHLKHPWNFLEHIKKIMIPNQSTIICSIPNESNRDMSIYHNHIFTASAADTMLDNAFPKKVTWFSQYGTLIKPGLFEDAAYFIGVAKL